MPRGFSNWSFNDTVRFLKDHHFTINNVEGSHYFYIGAYKGKIHQVCIPFHGSRVIHPKTLKSIIVQSGIPKESWFAGQ